VLVLTLEMPWRNKLIYAFADAALVVNSDLNKGGTWAGAIEQLDKLKFVPVFVRSTGVLNKGIEGLRRRRHYHQ
jgi:predicted Rossmann fold nucleotide-binding protein DprA/Smf involved in DNA uptake